MLFSSHVNHVSVSPTNGIGPTRGRRKTLIRVGIEPTAFGLVHTVRVSLCPCVGPIPLDGLTLTWFTRGENCTSHYPPIVNSVAIKLLHGNVCKNVTLSCTCTYLLS